MKFIVKCKKLRKDAKLPTKGSKFANAYDLYAVTDAVIDPGETVKIGTGIACELPEGYCAFILARSGLATKEGLRPANCVGLCDEDYRGEYIVAIHNDTNDMRVIKPGDRIAQVVFVPYTQSNFEVVDELSDSKRGAGGFGSTGGR